MLYSRTPELYDLIHESERHPDVDFYVSQCGGISGQVLELGCGTGRILIPIATSGVTITGIDASEHMIDRCRAKLHGLVAEIQSRVTIRQQKMQDLSIDQKIEIVIAPSRVLQHLITIEDQLACLNRVYQLLPSGGRFVFDVFTIDLQSVGNLWSGEEIHAIEDMPIPNGKTLSYSYRVAQKHPALQYNDVEFIYSVTDVDGTTERHVDALPWRYYFRFELEHLLDRSGFRIIDQYGNFDQSPLADDSPEMIFVAEKR